MVRSAIAAPPSKRLATADRINACALRLCDEHGLDGFTMDDLAAAADVSRRTLFNYFPGKIDAVLGLEVELRPDDVAAFRAGGPHGDLLEDLRTLLLPIIEFRLADRERLARSKRVLRTEPRVLGRVHEFYEQLSAEVVEHILVREDASFDGRRATVAVVLLAALFDASLESYITDSRRRPFVHHFDEALLTARSLLGS